MMRRFKKVFCIFLSLGMLFLQVSADGFARPAGEIIDELQTQPVPEKPAAEEPVESQAAPVIPPDSLVPQSPLSSSDSDEGPLSFRLSDAFIQSSLTPPQTYDSKGRLVREALPGQKVRRIVYVMEDGNLISDCNAGGDLGNCANQLIENKLNEEKLEIIIPEGVFTLTKETILIFQKDDILIRGSGKDKTSIQLADSLVDARGSRADRYFFINVINSSNVVIENLSLNGQNESGQRGIGVAALGNKQVHDIAVRNVEFENFALYATYVGAAYSDHFYNKYLLYGDSSKNTAERLRLGQFLEQNPQSRYSSGSVKNFTFESNTVYLSEGTGIGLVIEPYTAKQVPESVVITPENWFGIADGVASKNSGHKILNNTFIAQTNNVHAAIKVAHAKYMLIEGNRIVAEGFPDAFKGGAAINIAFNVLRSTIKGNEIIFPANHRYQQGGININSGFSKHENSSGVSYFGLGDKKLTTPAMDILIENNRFENARVRISDFSLNESPYIEFANSFEAGAPADENIQLRNNRFVLNGISQEDSALVWFASKNESSSRWFLRKNVQLMVVNTVTKTMTTWIRGVPSKLNLGLPNAIGFLQSWATADILACRLALEDLISKENIQAQDIYSAGTKKGKNKEKVLTLSKLPLGSNDFRYIYLPKAFPVKLAISKFVNQ